jgi:glycosyltransferase involved in cell wall biosynthesis
MNTKPTVALVAHDVGGQGGMERHLEEVIYRLKKDANVVVVANTMKLADSEGVTFIRVPVIKRPIPLKMLFFAIVASFRLLFVKYDILHTTGAIVWNRADFSTIHFCHAGYMKENGGQRSNYTRSWSRRLNSKLATAFALWMERFVYHPKRTKRIVAVSKRVKEEMLNSFPYSSGDIEVVPNGVDIHKFYPYTRESKALVRKSYDLPERGTFLLFMGGDWPRKGLDEVIQTFNQVAARFDDLILIVVGKGNIEQYRQLVDAKFRHRVHFVGQQARPQDWFGISDLFISPTAYETFSLVTHEAAAAGLIILSTKVGGVEDFIKDRINGFYIKRDPVQMAVTLSEVLSKLEDRQACGQSARMSVERLTWDHTYLAMASLYVASLTGSVEGRSNWNEYIHQQNLRERIR